MGTIFRPATRRYLAVLVAIAMLVSCMAPPPPRDPADLCAAYREPFERQIETYNTNITKWTLLGTGIGILAGVLARRKVETVIASAILGALTGALIGYLYEKSQQAKSADQLVAAIRDDSSATTREIEELREGLEKLNGCRVRQIRSLGEQVAAGTIDRAAARTRLAEIQRWVADDSKLVADVTGLTQQQTTIYLGAYASVTEPGQLDAIAAEWKRYEPELQPSPQAKPEPPARPVRRPSRTAAPPSPPEEKATLPKVASASARATDPIRKVAYAQKELEAESKVQKEAIERELADLELLLRTQAFTPAKAFPPA